MNEKKSDVALEFVGTDELIEELMVRSNAMILAVSLKIEPGLYRLRSCGPVSHSIGLNILAHDALRAFASGKQS